MNLPEVQETEGKYLKLNLGENKMRIMCDPIDGVGYWTPDKKPVRVKWEDRETIDVNAPGADKRKPFWLLPVWNYQSGSMQLFEITQKTIQKRLTELNKDEDWGDLKGYDISIIKTGEGMDTEYSVTPKPKKELPEEAIKAWEQVEPTLNLEAIFDGGDPFGAPADKKATAKEVVTKTANVSPEDEEQIDISDIPF